MEPRRPLALRRVAPVNVAGFDTFFDAQRKSSLFELIDGIIDTMTNRD